MFGKLFPTKRTAAQSYNDKIEALRREVDKLEKKEVHLDQQIQEHLDSARAKSKQRNKKGAISELKKKKQLENDLESIQIEKLDKETEIMNLEDEYLDQVTLQAMRASAEAMKSTVNESKSASAADELTEAMELIKTDVMNQVNDINDSPQNLIEELRQTLPLLTSEESQLIQQIQGCLNRAKEKSKYGDKQSALQELKQKKQLENELGSIQGKKLNIEIQIISLLDELLTKEHSEVMEMIEDTIDTIHEIRAVIQQYQNKAADTEQKIQNALNIAKEKAKRRDKKGALYELKKKKCLENHLKCIQDKKSELETQIMAIKDAALGRNNDDNNDHDTKCGECDELRAQKNSLQTLVDELLSNQNKLEMEKNQSINKHNVLLQNFNQLQNEKNGLLQRLKMSEEQNNRLNQQNTQTQSKLNTENVIIQQHQQQVQQLKMEKHQLLEQFNASKKNEALLMEQLRLSQDECKETQMEMNGLKKEINKLKKLKNIDTKRYREWSSDEVVDWIISVENGRFAKYEQKLRFEFNKDDVKGDLIGDINQSELKIWGIGSFPDRTNIMKHIKNLVGNKNVVEYVNDNEGNNYNATEYLM